MRELGAELLWYSAVHDRLDELCHNCDVVLYSAVMGGPKLPSIETFKRARQHCKLVCCLCDGGDYREVSPLLEDYKDQDVFDAIVNIDGNPDWPQREGKDFTYFGMFDPAPWEKVKQRTIKLGYNGAKGDPKYHRRPVVLEALGNALHAVYVKDYAQHAGKYHEYVDYMLSCRATVNTAWCGSGKAQNCKGRVNEAALAGQLLFENRGSPTNLWFIPRLDYIEYDNPQEILDFLEQPYFDDLAEQMGQRFKSEMNRKYGPERFWQKVMAV